MTYRTAWDELDVLDYFWLAARDPQVDRLTLLRQIADVALERPSEWDRVAVRQAVTFLKPMWLASESRHQRVTIDAEACWACLNQEHRIYLHHVITVAHGGSSTPRNLVPLCYRCHRSVHPFMPAPTSVENRYGWTALGDLVERATVKLERAWNSVVYVESNRRQVRDDGE